MLGCRNLNMRINFENVNKLPYYSANDHEIVKLCNMPALNDADSRKLLECNVFVGRKIIELKICFSPKYTR